MGRRKKAAKKVVKKVKRVVAKTFKCLFCNHEDAVFCKINNQTSIGELRCRVCDATFQSTITDLTEPIDIFRLVN